MSITKGVTWLCSSTVGPVQNFRRFNEHLVRVNVVDEDAQIFARLSITSDEFGIICRACLSKSIATLPSSTLPLFANWRAVTQP